MNSSSQGNRHIYWAVMFIPLTSVYGITLVTQREYPVSVTPQLIDPLIVVLLPLVNGRISKFDTELELSGNTTHSSTVRIFVIIYCTPRHLNELDTTASSVLQSPNDAVRFHVSATRTIQSDDLTPSLHIVLA